MDRGVNQPQATRPWVSMQALVDKFPDRFATPPKGSRSRVQPAGGRPAVPAALTPPVRRASPRSAVAAGIAPTGSPDGVLLWLHATDSTPGPVSTTPPSPAAASAFSRCSASPDASLDSRPSRSSRLSASPSPAPLAVPATATPPVAPADRASAWQRLQTHRWVRSAVAVGKLGADCLDLLGACLAFPITGRPLLRVVARNFRRDWAELRQRAPASPPPSAPVARMGASGNEAELISELQPLRGLFRKTRADKVLQTHHRTCRSRALVFAAALAMVGLSGAAVAFAPPLGAAMVVLSVFAARQAYANWRLARKNRAAYMAGGLSSPMGSSALGHALYTEYMADPAQRWTGAQAQKRAANRAAAVGVVNVVATAAVGGAVIGVGAHLPAILSVSRHVVRGVQSFIVPTTEAVNAYVAEDHVASLARGGFYDDACRNAWEAFFGACPQRARQYQAALGAHQARPAALLPRPRPLDGELAQDETVDFEPLVRWTRETRRFDELQAWFALDREAGLAPGTTADSLDWAQRLLKDLRAIDATRNRLRATQAVTAAGAVTMTGLGYGLA